MTTTFAPAQPRPAPAAAALRSLSLPGPAGRLEALVNEGAPQAPCAALLCHPHPLGGGNLHNKVVYHAMKALNDPQWGLGWPVLRFNFRGVGLSQGVHDGEAESGDVLAALDWLESEYHLPPVVVGFSFGAAMALRACCSPSPVSAKVFALAMLGLPTRSESGFFGDASSLGWDEDREYHYPCLKDCTIPKFFLSGANDQYAPAAQLAHVAASSADPKLMVLLPRADHFFSGQLEAMQQALADWLTSCIQEQVQ